MSTIFFDLTIIIVVSGLLAVVMVFTRQPIIIAYILAGVLLGPWCLKLVPETSFIDDVSHVGITMLLFLAGIVLHPRRLVQLFKSTALITFLSSLIFALAAGGIAYLFKFNFTEILIIGASLMFSSTILVIKLLPTTALHQKHMGAVSIAILIVQDIFAILILLLIKSGANFSALNLLILILSGIAFAAGVILFERYILRFFLKLVEYYHEMLYLLSLTWCFGVAMLANYIGLSHEIGAFIAGVALARNPISLFLSEGFKFFRDFFLVFFFFALGAKLDFNLLKTVLIPGVILAVILLALKPFVFQGLFMTFKESKKLSRETGFRLGQASEFAFIIAILANQSKLIGEQASTLIQLAAIITLIISSYIIVFFFPTPPASNRKLKQD
jgi:glutathione-regulated potassium-efflux system ancillary protein KefC